MILAHFDYCLSRLGVVLEVPGKRWRKETMTWQQENLNFFKDKEIYENGLNLINFPMEV